MNNTFVMRGKKIESYFEKMKRKDIERRKSFDHLNLIKAMFVMKDNIVALIFKEYICVLLFYFIICFCLKMDLKFIANAKHALKGITDTFDSFPEEIIVFLLGFIFSAITAFHNQMFTLAIPFIDDFALYCVTYFDLASARDLINLANMMLIHIFTSFQPEVEELFEDMGVPYTEDIYTAARAYSFHILKRAKEKLAQNETNEKKEFGKTDVESANSIVPKFEELLQAMVTKCDNLLFYNFLRPSYLAVSTMMIVCNIYLVHIFLDLIPFEAEDSVLHPLLRFTIQFIIFYGWPKAVTIEYLPIGHGMGKYNLFDVAVRNLINASSILKFPEPPKSGPELHPTQYMNLM